MIHNAVVATLVGLLAAAAVSAFSPAPAGLWWLNTFLQNQTIGEYAPLDTATGGYGLCPDFARRCTVDLATLPDSVKNIGVVLPEPFNSSVSLGSAIPTGTMSIYRLQINNVEIESTTVVGSTVSPSREKVTVSVKGFKANVDLIFTANSLRNLVSVNSAQVHVTKALQTNGTSVDFELFVETPTGKTLANSFPNNVTMGSCSIKLDLKLSVDGVITPYPFVNAQQSIANTILGVAEPILGNAVCGILRQVFTTYDGTDGFVNVLVKKAYDAVGNLTNKVQPTLAGEEAALVATLTPTQKAAAVNFAESTVVRGASVILNNWLGAGNIANPPVNEVVNLLTSPNNGSATFSNLERFGLSFPIHTPIAKVVLNVSTLSVAGLNTFSNIYGFQLIKNNYDNSLPRLNYTLDNKLSLDNIKVNLLANISLFTNYTSNVPPGWIFTGKTPLGLSQTRFALNYTLGLKDLDIALALSLITDPSQLKQIQIGQLLGRQDPSVTALGQLVAAGKCASPSMYGAGIPNFTLGLGDIVTPVFKMSPVDVGIVQLVDDVTNIVLTVLEDALTNQISLISQFWVRPLVNDIVKEFFIASSDADCPEYVSQGKTSLNLRDSIIFGVLSDVIRNAIGGDPVRPTLASINELTKQVVLFLCEAFASPSTCSLTGPGQWSFSPAFTLYPGQSFPSGNSYLALTGLNLNGVNSIYTLLLEYVPNTMQGVNLLLGLGTAGNPLQITIKNHWRVDYPVGGKTRVDELFDLKISLTQFAINATILPDFDLDQFYLLKTTDLLKSACLLAPFASLKFELGISANPSTFGITMSRSVGSSAPPTNPLRQALDLVISQQSGYTNVGTMFNFVLQSIGRFATRQLTGRNNSVVNALNCASQPNLFDNFVFRVLIAALSANLTDVFSKATGPQPAVLSPALLDASLGTLFGYSVYDLENSIVVPIVNNAVSGVSQQSYIELMQTLGNGTGDILSDSFFTENDASVSLDINFLQYDFFKDGFDLSFLIEDAIFYLNRVRLTNIDKLDMSSIRVIKPVSKFVLDTYISVPAEMKFLLSFGLVLPKSLKGQSGAPVLTTFNLSLSLVDLTVALQTLTALDKSQFDGLALGNFLTVDSNQTFSLKANAIQCLLRLFVPNGLSIPKLMIGLSSLGTPTISVSSNEFVSSGFIATINAMLEIIADFYVPDLADLTQGGLRVLLNKYLIEPNLVNPGVCENPTIPSLTGDALYLNFEKSSSITFINSLTRSSFAGKDGKYRLFNTVIGAALNNREFLKSPSNEVGFTDLNLIYKKVSFGTLSGYLRDLSMDGIGTFTSLNLLNAKSKRMIGNNLTISGPLDLEFGIKWSGSNLFLDDDGNGIGDELEIGLILTNLTVGFDLSMAVNIPELLSIQTGSFTNFSQIACLFATFENFSLDNFVLDLDKVQATLRCAGTCSSPLLSDLSNGIPVTTSSNSLANYIPIGVELLVSIVNKYLLSSDGTSSVISDADRSCAVSLNLTTVYAILNPEKVSALNVTIIFALALVGIGAAMALLAPLAIPRHYQLKDKMLAENLIAANKMPGANAQSVARYMAKEERDQIALAFHPAVNPCCKCFVPVMACVNVVLLFLCFLRYLSFSLDARVLILGSMTNTYTLVPWTIQSTINDMWNSGAWPLSILIIFASCAWPVLKNIALVAIWFAPKTFLNHQSRHWWLVQLDVLGKWSFLDVYIINIFVGALRFSLTLSKAPLLQAVALIPEEFLILDVLLTPGSGIVMLCTAAFMSLIVNHIIMWELDKAQWADRRLYKQIDGQPDDLLTPKAGIRLSISEYVFSTTTPAGQRDRYGPKAKNSIILLLGFAVLFLIVAFNVPYVTFTYDGLLGILIGFFIEGGQRRTFSLITIGTALPAASTGSAYETILFLFFAILYFATVVVAPVVQMVLHIILWLRPLSLKEATTVMFFAKVAAYWASMEVFALGIIATTIEIKPVTAFLVDFITGETCSTLVKVDALAFLQLSAKDNGCLIPDALLPWGFPIAFIANLFQIGCGAVMIRASGVAIRDREDVLERRAHQQWTYLEYLILDLLLVHGAAHHKPVHDPNKKSSRFERIYLDCSKNPLSACANCGSATCKKLDCCSSLCAGVEDVSLAAPVKGGKVTNSKWNAPPSVAGSSNKWNTGNYGAPITANPSWNMSQTPKSSQQMVVNNSMNLDSPNPVFAREQQRRYSIDV